MKNNEIARTQDWLVRICPFCHNQLSVAEYAKRKTIKICKCGECGRIINERIVRH
jgi:transcription elongation factor Elf1